MKYHINPNSGNPGKCNASVGNCPYANNLFHFKDPEAARVFYEESMSRLQQIASDKTLTGSLGSRILNKINESIKVHEDLHEELSMVSSDWASALSAGDKAACDAADERMSSINEDIRAVFLETESLKLYLDYMEWDDTDSKEYDDSLEYKTPTLLGLRKSEEKPHSLSGDTGRLSDEAKEVIEELKELTKAWVDRLSTAEVKAVSQYNKDATKYAKIKAGLYKKVTKNDEKFVKYFESAVDKAPRVREPVTLYSGVSKERAATVHEELDSGVVALDRIQSASAFANIPFIFADQKQPLILEFSTDRVASMCGFGIYLSEVEVLVHKGEYRVIEDFNQPVEYMEDDYGRPVMADRVVKLEPSV